MSVPLANSWECRGCGTANSRDSCFCKSCGMAVNDMDLDPRIRALDEVFRKRRDELLGLSAELTDRIEIESRKRIDTMIKLGGIIGFVGIIFGLVSYLLPMKEMLGDSEKRAAEADKKLTELETRIKASQAKFGESEAAMSKMRETEERIKQSDIKAATLLSAVDAQNRRARDVLNKAQTAENANYELFIYADPGVSSNNSKSEAKVSDTAMRAIGILNRAGYRLGNGDVVPVQVDRSQVVYYSELNQQKAAELRSLLHDLYPDIEISLKRNSDNGVRTLLLKLRDRPR